MKKKTDISDSVLEIEENSEHVLLKNTVPHLLEALWAHDECPKWLQDVVWDAFNDRIAGTRMSAAYWESQLENTHDTPGEAIREGLGKETAEPAASDHSEIATRLSRLLADDALPEPLQDGIREAIVTTFNEYIDQSEVEEFEDSPEYIGMVIRGYEQRKQEGVQ